MFILLLLSKPLRSQNHRARRVFNTRRAGTFGAKQRMISKIIKNPCFQIREPEDGLVVLGGLVHDTVALPDADVLIGRETFLEKHVDCFVEKLKLFVGNSPK